MQERVGDHLIALGGKASSVAAGVVERGVPAGGVRLQTADRDALDSVLSAVDRIGHVAQHAGGVAAVFIRHIHGHAGVGNAPARAGDDAGAVLFARADGCIAAQEVRGVVGIHAGHDVLRQGRGLGDPVISRAVVGAAGGVEGEQLRLHIAADLRRVLVVRAGIVLQIGDHVRQRRLIGCGNLAVILPERQLAGHGRGQLRVGDGVVLLLLTARQLTPLIDRHGLIAGLELRHRIGRRSIQLGHIIGQLRQQTAELRQIGLVVTVGSALQTLDGLDGRQLGVARLAGGLCRVNGRHGGVVGVLYLLPVLSGEHALGVLLVVVHGVQLLAQLLLHGVQIAGSGDVYQHGGAHGVAGLVGVRAERIQQDVALVVQGQGGLAALVRHGVGVHAHIARGGGLGALRRVAAVDRRARHGAGTGGGVEGQRRLRSDADGERLTRLHLHGGGNGGVTEIVGNIHQGSRIGARLAGILHLLGIDPHDGQLVLIVEPDGLERAGAAGTMNVLIAAGHAKAAVYQFPVQEHHRLGSSVSVLQQALAVQQVIGAGVGIQRYGRSIGIGVVQVGKLARVTGVDVVGIQYGYLYVDLRRGGGGQAIDGLSQLPQGGVQRLAFTLSHLGQIDFARQRQRRRPGVPQGLHALVRITRQRVRVVFLGQIPDGLKIQTCDGLDPIGGLFIQRLTGGGQFRSQLLDALLCGGLVGVGGAALGVEHRGHQGLGLVAGGLVRCPGFDGIVLRAGSVLQLLVQQRRVGTVSGDQLGDSGGEIGNCGVDTFLRNSFIQFRLSGFPRAVNSGKLRPKACLAGNLAIPAVIGSIPVARLCV